jgi:3-phenylpropionate/trans-cinnamate dioxygenase alpha subunit
MGLGHERFNEDLMAWASDWRMSESNHRHFYRRWAQLMATNSWAEVQRSTRMREVIDHARRGHP